jgi:hypothetical protein
MRPDGLELVHDYFESVLLQSADAPTTRVLLRTALLPRVTPVPCEAVTGDPAAIRVVERLYERQLFTMRSIANCGESYRYHALLREFLRLRAHAVLPDDERDRVLAAAALALEHEGEHEATLALHAERANWAAVERLLLSRAPHFIAAGRWRTFQDWAALLPGGRLLENPHLLLWVARARVYVDGGRALPLLETTYRAFEQRNDGVGRLLASAAALEALAYDFDDFVAMDPWIDRIAGLLAEQWTLARPDDELRVLSALLTGAVFRRPGHEAAADWARRIEALLQAPLDTNLRVGAATVLHGCYHATMDRQALHAAATARAFVGSPEVTPRMAGFYWAMEAYSHYLRADYPVALECFDRAEAVAVEHDLAELALHAGTWRGL